MSDEVRPSWMDEVKLCYQRVSSRLDIPPSNLAIAAGNSSGPYELAIGKEKFWSVGQTLKISWWQGEGQTASDSLKERVKFYAKQWDAICNINFDFGDYGRDADIRVAFVPKIGSWSLVGRDSLVEKRDQPTMNFSWLHDQSSDEEVRSVVLHEFGHALGCIHEHQNPAATINWNRNAVIKAYSDWDLCKIEKNILNPVATSMNSVFDPDSIMLYFYPAELTLDGKGTKANKELSAMDKNFIRKVYPPHGRNNGLFDTDSLLPKTPSTKPEASASPSPGLFNTQKVEFEPAYKAPPKMAIGLSRLDMACKANKAAAARVDQITESSAVVSISTWDTSVLNGGGATWVEADALSSAWQFGEFDTQEQRDRNDTTTKTAEKTIYFNHPYSAPPAVVVALKLIDLENHTDYWVKAYATDIRKDRFIIHVDTWGDSILYAGAATWIAYPADLSTAISVSFLTKENATKTTKRFEFPENKFVKKPTVRIFLNMIDQKHGADLRIKAWVDQITQNGLDWHADTWADSKMHQAGVSILAWA